MMQAAILPYVNQFDATALMNEYGQKSMPFFFLISFDQRRNLVLQPQEASEIGIRYNINGERNELREYHEESAFYFEPNYLSYKDFLIKFEKVQTHLARGNSFLLNLTFQTPLETDLSLAQIFYRSKAKYQLLFPEQFVVFSPETFVQVKDGVIYTYPMKGTVSANIPEARQWLMEDRKEQAEHITVVDLLRNDLSQVADGVKVDRYRYLQKVRTHKGELWQASSQISGKLQDYYQNHLGEMLFTLLPAGSITGAPKQKTLEIIREAEQYDRGFYTGIGGYFDGNSLDCGVLIRFIEQKGKQLFFKSGGGITFLSHPEKEYQEYRDKIYVPFY